ncbi:ligase-associated DNA damage response endonuclease PdeM [Henriciella sp.]|uniref:ligase-associated DNA damage response endonuclease PdeM n=1 Tax=Henriciella sp. TaxID=1968823 RepID=UPI00344F333D
MGASFTYSRFRLLDLGGGAQHFQSMSPSVSAKLPDTFLCVAGEMFLPTGQGALWWERERTLVVSDLHFEKGSNFAARGQLLPPYDTGATLALVEGLVESYRPKTVISLGDSFHDPQAEYRLGADAVTRIRRLTSSVEWYWVEGNHDPDPPAHLGGKGMKVLERGPCVFRHEPTGESGEISGHLHPIARVGGRGRALRRKCFVTDGSALVLPSLGTFTGGLNVLDTAIAGLFRNGAMVFAVNGSRVHFVERAMLRPDRAVAGSSRAVWRL